jgi:hypothetical protein
VILPRSPHLCHSGGLSILSSIRKEEKIKVAEGDSHVVFGQTFPGGKGSVRQCIVMMQQPVLLSPKFEAKSSHIFTQSL